jgi:DNA-directed RNA polymerase
MEKLNLLVKVKFIELYSQSNFLEKFHKLNKKIIQENGLNILYDEQLDQEYILIKRTKNYLPNIPKIGNLDLNDIINSKYMIT